MSGPYTIKEPYSIGRDPGMPQGQGYGMYNPTPPQAQQPQEPQSPQTGGFGNILMNILQGGLQGMGATGSGSMGMSNPWSMLSMLGGGGMAGGLQAILKMIQNHGNPPPPQQPQQQQMAMGRPGDQDMQSQGYGYNGYGGY